MTVKVKICGLTTAETITAAVTAGASYIGFVFFDKSPRNISPQRAGKLAELIPGNIIKCGVLVNPSNDELDHILTHIPLDLIQLHGDESPARTQEIRDHFTLPVMKAIAVAGPDDITLAKTYENMVDMVLFDAKPPPALKEALPGGNGLSFDWQLIRGADLTLPWMLSGGLKADNLAQAIATSGARMVDVSSGVEDHPGEKNITRIKAFLRQTRMLNETG